MRYQFLVGTYETERLKVLSVWSMFRDGDLPIRPHATDTRGRSVVKGGVNLDHFGGAKVDQLVKG